MDVADKTILITGAARGLGQSMALALAAKGARLALADMDAQALEQSVARCAESGSEARSYAADISREDAVEALFAQAEKDLGPVCGLINNAGIIRDALMVKVKDGEIVDRMSLAQWQAVIDVNLSGVFLCGREAATQMIRNGSGGVIVNISSISRAGNIGQSNYAAAKAGVAALTVTWAKELARFGIRCGAIAPGVIATDMTAGMKPEALEKLSAGIPLKRLGRPEEVAAAALHIFENDYFSGRIIELDGAFRI